LQTQLRDSEMNLQQADKVDCNEKWGDLNWSIIVLFFGWLFEKNVNILKEEKEYLNMQIADSKQEVREL